MVDLATHLLRGVVDYVRNVWMKKYLDDSWTELGAYNLISCLVKWHFTCILIDMPPCPYTQHSAILYFGIQQNLAPIH